MLIHRYSRKRGVRKEFPLVSAMAEHASTYQFPSRLTYTILTYYNHHTELIACVIIENYSIRGLLGDERVRHSTALGMGIFGVGRQFMSRHGVLGCGCKWSVAVERMLKLV